MFDVAPQELLLVAMVALVVIGPKDLPKAMRFVGFWVGRARGMMRQVRSGFDSMVREAELQEMEKKWAAENERIMREHRPNTEHMLPGAAAYGQDAPQDTVVEPVAGEDAPPRMAEQPVIQADVVIDQPADIPHGNSGEPAAEQKHVS